MPATTPIDGACHCGNIRYTFLWPSTSPDITVRECGCTFCQKHQGAWTSHPKAILRISVQNDSRVSKYQFGTRTAEFYVCSNCGVVPFVTSDIAGNLYAVVNVNTFNDMSNLALSASSTNFDGEATGDRLERRRRNWITDVEITYRG